MKILSILVTVLASLVASIALLYYAMKFVDTGNLFWLASSLIASWASVTAWRCVYEEVTE